MPATEPVILSTATALPAHAATQAEVKARTRQVFPLPGRRMDAALGLFDNASVEQRFSVQPPADLGRRRTIEETQQAYREHALGLGRSAVRAALARAAVDAAAIDLIVSVSCTGVMIPSLDAYLCNELGFRPDVRRMPMLALGCVGGAAALARATDFLVGFPKARALVVAVELPSLNVQPDDLSMANLVSTALFGDGAAAVVLQGGQVDGRGDGQVDGRADDSIAPRARVLETQAHLFPDSTGALGFDLRDDGFHSVLSAAVPALLGAEIGRLVDALAARRGLTRDQLASFVFHPGGRKILTALEDALNLIAGQAEPSWEVLRAYGNQSSASVLFVLDAWMNRAEPPNPGTHGVLGAFGPGLSAELMLLRWE